MPIHLIHPIHDIMRSASAARIISLALLAGASPLGAQQVQGGLLSPHGGLMFWTLVIFLVLFAVLARAAFPKILGAVEARERALEEAIEGAKRDREEAARMLSEQKAALDASRGEAQKLLADSRATAERARNDMIEQTRAQQQEMLERARRDIEQEKERAIADLRREAIDLAIAGAGKVIERNLDDDANRKLVEQFLASVPVKS